MSTPGGEGGRRWDEEAQCWVGEGAEPPAPGRRPPNPHLGTVLLAVLAVVLVGGIGVGAWKLVSGGGDDKPRADGGSPSASSWSPSAEQPTTVPSGPFSETTSAPPSVSVDSTQAPPTGYVRTTDAEGFRLDVPRGWQRVKRDTGVFYESSDASSLIQVFALTEPGVTPYEALRQAEAGLKKNAGYQRYELKRLGPGDDADAELEYGYRSAKYGPRRILDRAFTGPDQVQYAVLVAGPAGDWPRQRERQRIVLASFCPTAYCPAT
ncbi:hypothetical protein [Streptomyces antimycoticus]|uniref:hypothetical protein n=1 Tax=Streptomyces antimycoticus TaxID=68175 RepID=UPI0025707837|nr:hypothetical protein [Streptomyces antimycoticus]WJD98954.1 hypothetical protein QR300_24840 [Streptomyces antimycoticus]